jgi:type VI secretion system protein ImpA
MDPVASPWLMPVSGQFPCGPSLEYDPEYALLLARLMPRVDAQYGSFIDTPDAPNWAEVERDCQRLLVRTRDINLLVWLCRARTRLAGAAGLEQVLATLGAVLRAWPDEVHPQVVIDGEREPMVRANALAGLADPDGLVGDLGEVAVVSGTAMGLTVRDVARAFSTPRTPDAASPESVSQQLAAVRVASTGDAQAPLHLLARCAGHVRAIDAWARSQLGDDAPSLQGLGRMLDWFAEPAPPHAAKEPTVRTHAEAVARSPLAPLPIDLAPVSGTRASVLADIRRSREWFEMHEPSSPVAVLLRQSERLVGKRFAEVAHAIPADLLQKWSVEDDALGDGR